MAATAAAMTAAQMASAATVAISVAATAVSIAQARANADAQEKAQEQRNEQLVEQTIANYGELSEVERDAQQRALDESHDVQKDYIREKGRVNVMAAAMGTGGMSVKSSLQDLERQKYSNYNTILNSRQAEMDNIKSQAESMRYQAASSMDVSPVSRPSYAAAALNMGSTALSGYSSYQQVSREAELLKKPAVTSGG